MFQVTNALTTLAHPSSLLLPLGLTDYRLPATRTI